MLQIRFLGQFDVRVEGKPLLISTRAAQSLFAFLVLNAAVPHRREKLAGLLWFDTPDENARRSLRQELWRLRKALAAHSADEANALSADELTVTFLPRPDFWFDVQQLENQLAPDVPLNERINRVAVFQGELLPGFYEDWILLERERVQSAYETQMRELLEHLIAGQHWQSAVSWAEKWIAFGQTPEAAYRALMLTYAMLGDRAQCVTAYERCKAALEKELDVEPSSETQELYQELMRGDTIARVSLNAPRVLIDRAARHDVPPAPGEPPFKGLDFFDEADASIFFGREALIEKLAHEVRATRFLAVVVGASGSGKSSVVRAGLIPALRGGAWRGESGERKLNTEDWRLNTDDWQIYVMTPTAHPLEALAVALTRDSESVTATATLLDDLVRDPRSLQLFTRRMSDHQGTTEPRHLLVVDQFEELFTLCRDEFEREQFIDNLLDAVTVNVGEGATRSQSLMVILTLRADFYAHLAQYPDLRDAAAKQQEYIGPMTVEELRRAMEEPARVAGWEFEPGLVDLMLRDVGDEPGALPLLSHALLETWKRRSGHTLTLKGYHDAGGVRGAIAQTAENVFQQFTAKEQELARAIFLRLTELGEATEDTRRRASFDELIPRNENAAFVHTILTRLADARLITLNEDTAEVAHEALIREWPQLREWLNQDRDGLRLHRQITDAVQEWEMLERDTGALYRGARLIQARDFADKNPFALNAQERAFLEASEENENRESREREEQQRRELEQAQKLAETESRRAEEQRRGARRLRWFAAGLALFLIIALGAAWFAFNQSNVAQNNFVAAERIRLASQAQIALDNGEGGDLPALLSLQSLKHGYSPEADASLLSALKRGFTRQIYVGHTGLLWSADFSSDGKKMVTTSNDGTARLWEVETGNELLRFAPGVRILDSAMFAPDGRNVLVGGPGNVAWLWDTQTGQQVRQFTGLVGGDWGADFSSDGKYVVIGDDKVARLFDVQRGEQIREFVGHTNGVSPAIFSPNDRYIATSSADDTARVWDAATGQELHRFVHTGDVLWAAFSLDNKSLFTASGNIVQQWDIASEKEIQRFVGHTGATIWGALSPDSKYLATASADKTARLWDIATGQELKQFIGHTGGLFGLTFSPDGHFLLTAGADRTARLWDVQSETEPRRTLAQGEGNITSVSSVPTSLSPDTTYLIYGYNQPPTAVIIWNTQTGARRYLKLQDVTNYSTLSAFAISPDNRFVLGGSDDGVVWLWDAQTGKKLHQLSGHTAPVRGVSFSPEGRFLLSGSEDKTARLWDAQTGKELQQFVGHTEPVRAIAFSPDGKFVWTGSDDKTARLWEAQTGKELRQFVGHSAPLRAVNFSPDGKWIATSGDDQTARVWDAQTGKELQQFIGHTGQVSQVAFSPDGKFIVTGGDDQTARMWDAQTGEKVRKFVGHASPVLYLGFADNGHTVITGDSQNAYRWRASLDDVLTFTCAQLTRDLTTDERVLYRIADNAPTCR